MLISETSDCIEEKYYEEANGVRDAENVERKHKWFLC